MKLKPYPEYRDSGVPWLGQIPVRWETRRNGRLFSQRVETGFPELPILEVSLKTGVRVRDMDDVTRKQVMSDPDKYKKAVQGDIAYNMMRMWQGAVGMAPTDGLISPAYVVARPYQSTESRYYSYLFRTGDYMDEVNKYSRGIVSDRNRLYWGDFKQMPSAFPPSEEQRKIADFLDAHGLLMRRLIQTKLRLIELLNEQKQAIIHQAVIRGLDPNAPMKPTGLDWVPEVPKHWEVKALKRIGRFRSGVGFPVIEQGKMDLELPFFKVSDMSSADNETSMTQADSSISHETAATLGATVFPEGTIVFPKVGGAMLTNKRRFLGHPSCIDNNMMGCVVHHADNGYVFLLLCQIDLGLLSKPGPVPAIGEGEIREIRSAWPPIREQREIVLYIKKESATLDAAIDHARREIELIREYRTRLISDVATGKLDVRGVKLPDMGDETAGPVPLEPENGAMEELLATGEAHDANL